MTLAFAVQDQLRLSAELIVHEPDERVARARVACTPRAQQLGHGVFGRGHWHGRSTVVGKNDAAARLDSTGREWVAACFTRYGKRRRARRFPDGGFHDYAT